METSGLPFDYWGKAHLDDDGNVVRWHPKMHHAIDVASTFRRLLDVPLIRKRLANAAHVSDLDHVQAERLVYDAFAHDVSKIASGFQAKIFPKDDRPPTHCTGHVRAAAALFIDPDIGAIFRRHFPIDHLISWFGGEVDATRMLLATVSHHGTPLPLTVDGDDGGNRLRESASAWRSWKYADPEEGLARTAEAAVAFAPDAFDHAAPIRVSPTFLAQFVGVLTLADWLASDEDFFPFSRKADERRENFAREAADRAVRSIPLDPGPERAAAVSLPADFAGAMGLSPSPIQRALPNTPIPSGGSTTVVDSPTGSGKTEAMLHHFWRLFRAGEVDSLYLGLPTRTSGVAMHRRVDTIMRGWFGDDGPRPVLAVPGYTRVGDHDGVPLPGFDVRWDEDVPPGRWAAEDAKRYLAAFAAVGTFDQALLSSLRTKHAHFRLSALSRALVVIDEVHASDAYTGRIIREMIRNLRALGAHVLVMSATLGSSARVDILSASEGVIAQKPSLERARSDPFPAVWNDQLASPVHTDDSDSDRDFIVETRPWMDDPSTVADAAAECADTGARVLVIRNSVRDANETLEALASRRPDLAMTLNATPCPHHGRFSAPDRAALDQRVEELIGKGVARDCGVVIVGTQTLQQSLDVDADFLITDACPIDVLLQRIGREHRHVETPRPEPFAVPRTFVLTPADRDFSRFTQSPDHGIGRNGDSVRAYDDVRTVEACVRLVESRGKFTLPADNRDLVESGTHPEALDHLARELGSPWLEHQKEVVGASCAESGAGYIATHRLDAHVYGERGDGGALNFVLRDAATRLGESDVEIPLEATVRSPFGFDITSIRIPSFLAHSPAPDDLPANILSTSNGRVRFSVSGTTYVYDALGIRKESGNRNQA